MSEWRTLLSDDRQRAHNVWFDSGRRGDGRIDLEDKNLSEANLRGMSFNNARFVRCDLERAAMTYGTLQRVEMRGCRANGAVFVVDDLHGAILRGLQLRPGRFPTELA